MTTARPGMIRRCCRRRRDAAWWGVREPAWPCITVISRWDPALPGFHVAARLPFGDVDVTVRVGVVDDQPLIRTGLRSMIDHAADLDLVGEGTDGEQAVELARRLRPDVVLMDIRMPVLDGIEATRRIASDAALSGVRVVMLTTFDVDDYVHAAIRAGASGFLLKDAPPAGRPRRHPGCRPRRRSPRPERHPPDHRGAGRTARSGPSRPAPNSTSSPIGNGRC